MNSVAPHDVGECRAHDCLSPPRTCRVYTRQGRRSSYPELPVSDSDFIRTQSAESVTLMSTRETDQTPRHSPRHVTSRQQRQCDVASSTSHKNTMLQWSSDLICDTNLSILTLQRAGYKGMKLHMRTYIRRARRYF